MSRQSSGIDLVIDSGARIVVTEGGALGWRDLVGSLVARATGAGNPSWAQMGASPMYAYAFAVNDAIFFTYHIDHDYARLTDIFLHAHWTTNGTSTATVKWEFTYMFAKGHNQANFDVAGNGTVVNVTQAAAGTAWRHMIGEFSAGVLGSTLEIDGLLLVKVKRVTNGGAENGDTVFLLTSDAHYQTDRHATLNKAPNFYA